MDRRDIDFKFLYPNLIIFLGSNKNEPLFKQLDKSFKEFKYGPLFKKEGRYYKPALGSDVRTCQIMQGAGLPICLAEGEGALPCDAEQQALERLLDKLCESCYVVKANQLYFTRKNIPTFALEADPSQSHVYKVVFLRKNSHGVPFPKPVSGAVDYVETYNELMSYIETHGKRDTKADLFILNVLKHDRQKVKQACQAVGMSVKFMVGCSDMGVYAFHQMSTLQILQKLLKDGGKNDKYKLIGPRDKYGDNDDRPVGKVDADAVQSEHSIEEEGEIVINQWIADHLVIMEAVTDRNELRPALHTIRESVRDCPDTQQFIIEKKTSDTGMIVAEAMIDRNVVARARGFKVQEVKAEAAEKAMINLLKYCYYIQVKQSYFGTKEDVPYFLRQPMPVPQTKIYRIADKRKGPPNKILQQFKSSWQEDLYFLNDFTEEEKLNIEILADKMHFLVRWLGRMSYLCVSKKRKPKEVLMELLSTNSHENEKYKLIIPPSKMNEQVEGRATHRNWNNQGTSRDAQANTQPFNRGQESYNPPSVSDAKATTSDYQSSYVDRGSGSQSFEQFQPRGQESYNPPSVSDAKSTSAYKSPYSSHESASQSFEQGAEASGQGNNETPNWVMKFIQSAPLKPKKPPPFKMSRPIEPPRHRDDVYNRYKFVAPKTLPPPVTTSNVNFRGADQRPDQNAERDNATPSQHLDQGSSLSERLQRLLEEQNRSDRQDATKQVPSTTTSNKRPYDQWLDVKKEWEPSEKISRNTTNTYSSSYNSPVASSNVNAEQREERGERNMYIKNESGEDTSKSFDMRQDYTQHNNPHWDQGTKQHYDQRRPNTSTGGQRNFTDLFDYTGSQSDASQGVSRPTFPPRPPPPWRKNRQFKGHSFSKLEKYGKKKGPY